MATARDPAAGVFADLPDPVLARLLTKAKPKRTRLMRQKPYGFRKTGFRKPQ